MTCSTGSAAAILDVLVPITTDYLQLFILAYVVQHPHQHPQDTVPQIYEKLIQITLILCQQTELQVLHVSLPPSRIS